MGHVPHLLVSGPWGGEHLELSAEQKHHLEKVIRVRDGDPATYTDGAGSLGQGRYASGWLARDEESQVPAPSDLIVVVAPPDNRDRARFMVEKLAEMGVAELLFLDTKHGQGRPPSAGKLLSWAVSGLEQSRGAWLMKTSDRLATFGDLRSPFAVCDQGGIRETPLARHSGHRARRRLGVRGDPRRCVALGSWRHRAQGRNSRAGGHCSDPMNHRRRAGSIPPTGLREETLG